MAFHLHLINSLCDFIPGAAPQLKQNDPLNAPIASQLSLRWELGEDGRPRARWIRN